MNMKLLTERQPEAPLLITNTVLGKIRLIYQAKAHQSMMSTLL